MNLSPLPIQKFFDNNGRPLVGGLLFIYEAVSTTKVATYSDQAGTLNTNPVVLDFRGECRVWLDPLLSYKFVLSPEGDTDPPTKPIWTVDMIEAGITISELTQQLIGRILWPRTANEIAADVTPADYAHSSESQTPTDAERYNPSEFLRNSTDLVAVFGQPRTKPTGFSYVSANIFECREPGIASHDFDAEQDFMFEYSSQTGASEYWVAVDGSDLNVGSLNAPFATIKGCLQNAAGIGTIWLMPGTYTVRFDVRASDNTIGGGTLARAVRIKPWGGPDTVIFRAPGEQPGEMVWALTAGTGFEYEATPVGGEDAAHIIYHEDGREIQLQWYSSAANVNAQASGWFQDSGTKKVYIRHQNLDLTQLGIADRFEIFYTPSTSPFLGGGKIYLEGFTFRGGNQFLAEYETTFRPILYARYCKWQYLGYHNFQAYGLRGLFQDCVSEHSLGGDGWNYNDDPGTDQSCEITEVDCIGRFNGIRQYKDFDGDRNKQGSSGHDSSVILRVNGEYYGNYGQSIADTGSGSRTWMVGTICGNPQADLTSGGIGPYFCLWTEGAAHLDCVRAGGRASDYGLWIESGVASMYRAELYGTTSPIGVNIGSSGIYNPVS